jgi:hypothetical protein
LRDVVLLDRRRRSTWHRSSAIRRPGPGPDPDDAATIVFTSARRRRPGRRAHARRSAWPPSDATVLGIEPDDRTWGYLPFFFAVGGLVVAVSRTRSSDAGVQFGQRLALVVDGLVRVFVRGIEGSYGLKDELNRLRAHPRFAETRLSLCKGVGANTKWAAALYGANHHAVGSYGMTETPPLCTAWPWDAPLARRTGGHGTPVGRRELRIVDPDGGRCSTGARTARSASADPSCSSATGASPVERVSIATRFLPHPAISDGSTTTAGCTSSAG